MKKTILPVFALLLAQGAIGQTHFSDDFNDGNLTGWTSVDNDADPTTSPNYDLWYTANFSSYFAANGAGSAVSRSWASINGASTALHPNNFLISPAINLTAASATGLSLQFKTGSIEAAFPDEHYAVYVTTSADPAVIITTTPVFEETLPSDGMFAHLVNMSAYAGQTVYITFRHFNTVDMNTLLLDDVFVKNLPANDAFVLSSTLNRYSAVSTNNTLTMSVRNDGSSAITSMEVNWNDGADHTQTISGLNIAPGAIATVTHPTPVNYATITEKLLNITISQVNAAADATPSNNTGTEKINTVSALADKKVVIEEGTGTWCGWCPRGAVAMNYMTTTYPDDFIGIAVHNDDPMTVTEYDAAAALTGYPGANIDRALLNQGVSQAAFVSYYNARKDLVVPASISATGTVSGSNITIDVTTKFFTSFAAGNFRLAAIITEDDVTGTGTGYNQTNYYAGGGNGAMGGYESLPSSVPAAQMVYDHVGRALLGGYAGQAGSVPAAITDGQTVNYTFNYTVPATSTIADMHIVAVLIDQETGEIVNAHEIEMAELGISNNASVIGMQVYPNPATDVVNVKFEGQGGNYTVVITDLSGRQMATSSVSNATGAQTVALDVNGLAGGNYLVTIATEGGSYTQQVVVR